MVATLLRYVIGSYQPFFCVFPVRRQNTRYTLIIPQKIPLSSEKTKFPRHTPIVVIYQEAAPLIRQEFPQN